MEETPMSSLPKRRKRLALTIASGENRAMSGGMLKRTLTGAALLALAAVPLDAARGQAFEQALMAAYLGNPQIEAARAALRATDELVPQALAGWRPRLQLDSSAVLSEQKSPLGSGSINTRQTALRLEQPIYRGGETTASTSRAESLVRAERARLLAAEQDVLLTAVAAYTTLLRDQVVLDLAIANEQRLRRQLEATRDRFSVGEVTRTDVAQAEARVSGAVAERVRAEGALIASRAAYLSVIGEQPPEVLPDPPQPPLPGSEAEAQAQAAANPVVDVARFSLAAAESDVDVAFSALMPRVSLSGELSYADEPSRQIDWQRSAAVGATVSVPLYQGGGEYSRVRQQRQVVSQRRNDLDGARRQVRQEVTAAWESLETSRARIRSFEEQVRANEIALDGVRQEAMVGARTTLDVLDAEQELFASEVELEQARADSVVAAYRLKAAVGELTVAALGLAVDTYDAEAHYRLVRDRWFGLNSVKEAETN
jgi:TolC family type I secretion outer membrane protein